MHVHVCAFMVVVQQQHDDGGGGHTVLNARADIPILYTTIYKCNTMNFVSDEKC